MPRPSMRTRSRKRKLRPLPGAKSKTIHGEEKRGSPKCSSCGRTMAFLPRSESKIRKLPKNQKRISRAYGGQLCHTCLRDLLKQASRRSQ